MNGLSAIWEKLQNIARALTSSDPVIIGYFVSLCRRAIKDGYGMFILSTSLVLCMALTMRAIILRSAAHLALVRSNIADTLQANQIARRGEHYAGVTGALLHPYSTRIPEQFAEDCQPSRDAECSKITAAWQIFDSLYQGVHTRSAEGAAAHIEAATKRLKEAAGQSIDTALWKSEAVALVARLQSTLNPAKPNPADTDRLSVRIQRCIGGDSDQAPHQGDYGPKGCDANDDEYDRVTRLTIPSIGWADGKLAAESRVRRAGQISLLLDLAIRPFVPGLESSNGSVNSRLFVQAYFISLDDVLRIWHRPVANDDLVNGLPPLRRWASEDYVEAFTRKPVILEYLSPPYIDFGGSGLVRSWCHPLIEGELTNRQLIGVVCEDYTIPVGELAKSIADSSFLVDVSYAQLMPSQLEYSSQFVCVRDQYPPDCSRTSDVPDAGVATLDTTDERQEAIAQLVRGRVATTGSIVAALAELSRATTPVFDLSRRRATPDEHQLYLVPLGLLPDGSYRAALVTASPRLPRELLGVGLVTLATGLIWVLVVLVGGRQAQRLAEKTEQIAFLRTLQVGVIVVSSEDIIEEANDRAEEIFGVPLPKIGADPPERHLETRFDRLIRGYIVERINGQLRAVKYSRVIPRRRLAGEPSKYYAKITKGSREGRWVMITGSPVLAAPNAPYEARSRTFGVIEPVLDPVLESEIEVIHSLRAPQIDAVVTGSDDAIVAMNGRAADVLGLEAVIPGKKLGETIASVVVDLTRCEARALSYASLVCVDRDVFYARLIDDASGPKWIRLTRSALLTTADNRSCVNVIEKVVNTSESAKGLLGSLESTYTAATQFVASKEPRLLIRDDLTCSANGAYCSTIVLPYVPALLSAEGGGARFHDIFTQVEIVTRLGQRYPIVIAKPQDLFRRWGEIKEIHAKAAVGSICCDFIFVPVTMSSIRMVDVLVV